MVDNGVLQHVDIQRHLERSGTHRRHLPEHHVLGNTMAVILLSNSGSLHQNLDRLLE
jgi:hypothetical protein